MDNSPDKVLVVDGSMQSSDLVSYWLAREGFTEVYTANSGQNALTKAELIEPDVVVINVDLPDISGFDLCKKLKTLMSHVLILCISHVDSSANRVRAMETGADDYMDTVESYQFISKIRSLFRVKQLSNQIRKQYAELEERNKLMESHMQMGRRVQHALIPDIDETFSDCRILSMYQPAMGVGGDFYNVLHLNDHSLGIVMGDVSGHGISASFLTVTLNVMIKNLGSWHFHPGNLLLHLNNEMCELFGRGSDDPELYACVFYAVVDTRSKTIKFANAGLTLPLFITGLQLNKDIAGTQVSKHGIQVNELEARGAPIGMIKNVKYDEQFVSYDSGDMVLFYTDGLQDCFYKNQPDEFLRLIKDLLVELAPGDNMREILDVVSRYFYKADLTEHERMEMDDVSMLLCRL